MRRIARSYGDELPIPIYTNEPELVKRAKVKVSSMSKKLFKRAKLLDVTIADLYATDSKKGGSQVTKGTLVVKAMYRQGIRTRPFLFAFDIEDGDITEMAGVFYDSNGTEHNLDKEGARYAMSITGDSIVNTAGDAIKNLIWRKKVKSQYKPKDEPPITLFKDLKTKRDKQLRGRPIEERGIPEPEGPIKFDPDAQRKVDPKNYPEIDATPEQEAALEPSFQKLNQLQSEIQVLEKEAAALKSALQPALKQLSDINLQIQEKKGPAMDSIAAEMHGNLGFTEDVILNGKNFILQLRHFKGDFNLSNPNAETILQRLIEQVPEIKGKVTRLYNLSVRVKAKQPDLRLIRKEQPEDKVVKSQVIDDIDMGLIQEIRVELFELAKVMADWGKMMVELEGGAVGITPSMPTPLPVAARRKTLSQNEIIARWNRGELTDMQASDMLARVKGNRIVKSQYDNVSSIDAIGVTVLNLELDEPYCYKYLDSDGNWVGVGSYDPEKIIPDELICTPEGYVYSYYNGRIGTDLIDDTQYYEEWERMVGDPSYPSAKYVY